ncbi:glycosyltransferase family 39 protein [Clostridium uliginosum]|uniref:Dolichyl-phosphate-mannose-protein mannosyltransferase n=1 Tax=Clostridium uliginosum TaxID=119641 RepID=A0A1I1ILV3_9CLOT|nr:glycosyltransferase family 39 protein [Clostridium uliginosum]SFC37274.1 Dolichyl-phosphate-mannose-protein mannosyltransferase [Clostridium uliginosum]
MKIQTMRLKDRFKIKNNKQNHIKNNNKYFEMKFSKFMVYYLRIIITIITLAAIGELGYYTLFKKSFLNIGLISLYIVLSSITYFVIKKKVNKRIMISLMLFIGLVLRIIWTFSLTNVPVSDFSQAYKAAISINNGDYSPMMGTSYFGRFPHLTILILYFSRMILIFKENSLIAIKIMNIIFSTSTILLIYLILNEVFKEYKTIVIGTFISAIMPASILYTPVYCSENIAIPFYLASLYCFILVMNKKKKDKLLIVSGILLFIGHLFRMVAQIIVIGYILYIIIYYRKSVVNKFKNTCYILCSFIIPFIIISNLLVSVGITDQKLWNGSEPHVTSMLKGSNIENFGQWNEGDAKFINENLKNREYLEITSKNKIIDRYMNTNIIKTSIFIIGKISMQWCEGDSGGAFWAQLNLDNDKYKIDIYNKGNIWYQIFHVLLLIGVLKGLFNKKMYLENKIINIFYIIFCGYGLTFLILESQSRYAFIINWNLLILSLTSIQTSSKDVLPVTDRQNLIANK